VYAENALKLPRLPLPAKLFLSYLLVLAAAAVPTFVYVHARLAGELKDEAAEQLKESANRTAALLGRLSPEERLTRTQLLGRMTADRVTLIAPSGEVLFDSEVADTAKMQNHRERPEVKAAIAGAALNAANGKDTIAERKSESTGHATLYVATRIAGATNETLGVLRVARPVAKVLEATDELERFTRNVLAIAVSIAFLFALLAAVQFVRPLQRVTTSARALAAGDLSVRNALTRNDEVGDVARAIDQMAVEIRRRLASAGSGDAVLAQLVDGIEVPCVIFEVTGEVHALNGAARTALRVEGPNASRRLKEITTSPEFERALQDAEGDSEPEPIDVDVAPGVRVHAHVHVLKRPGTAPLYALLGAERPPLEATTLPPLDGVRPRPFLDVMNEAKDDARAALERSGVALEMQDAPRVLVVDVGHRVPRAVAAVLEGCAASFSGRGGVITMDVKVGDTRVELLVEADPGIDALRRAQPLLEPLGGAVRVESGEASLWLPRA
jgi:HAMP domain-containing protein